MFRRHLAAALAALLAAAACAPCASAQSGRRLPRAGGGRGSVALTNEKPGAAKGVGGRRVEGKAFGPRDLHAGGPAPVVYAGDGRGCKSTKCRVAVGAFLAYPVFAAALWAASDDPYAPRGAAAQIRRVH